MKLSLAIATAMASIAGAQTTTDSGSGFMALIHMKTNATLDGNTDLIGVHLHTGSSTVNGPINIIYCMGEPLPSSGNWENCAELLSNTHTSNGVFTATFLATYSVGAWDNGVNNATAIPGAMTMADGAPTTYDTFMTALEDCTVDNCEAYFNWHSRYSFSMNPGYGLGRAQLAPLNSCPSSVSGGSANCYGTQGPVTSSNTNMVTGLNNTLPDSAGYAEVLIIVPTSSDVVTVTSGSTRRMLRGKSE